MKFHKFRSRTRYIGSQLTSELKLNTDHSPDLPRIREAENNGMFYEFIDGAELPGFMEATEVDSAVVQIDRLKRFKFFETEFMSGKNLSSKICIDERQWRNVFKGWDVKFDGMFDATLGGVDNAFYATTMDSAGNTIGCTLYVNDSVFMMSLNGSPVVMVPVCEIQEVLETVFKFAANRFSNGHTSKRIYIK